MHISSLGILISLLPSCEPTCEHNYIRKYDDLMHYNECSKCGKINDSEEHSLYWKRTDNEHYQECFGCLYSSTHENHESGICNICADVRILSFGFDSGGDPAHADFAKEANNRFKNKQVEFGFTYEFAGNDWSKCNDENLSNYDLIMFLNDRPHDTSAQDSFEEFMKNGGAWMGFHAAAFCMDEVNPADHWFWYQDEFLGCGDYKNNTWNPTSEPLRVETHDFCATTNIEGDEFISAPCERYGWKSDLNADSNIEVLLTLNPTTGNPAGDQPDPNKQYEIWTEGTHPIAWTNKDYKMVYMNWGHNLQSYNNGVEGTSSETFSCKEQCQFMVDAILGLGIDAI